LNASHCDLSFPFLIVNQLLAVQSQIDACITICDCIIAGVVAVPVYHMDWCMGYHVGWTRKCGRGPGGSLVFNSNSVTRGANVAASPASDYILTVLECLKARA
jgi:hypothetical protein